MVARLPNRRASGQPQLFHRYDRSANFFAVSNDAATNEFIGTELSAKLDAGKFGVEFVAGLSGKNDAHLESSAVVVHGRSQAWVLR